MDLSNSKIMYVDLETSFNLAAIWRPGKQHVAVEQIVQESKIICAAWVWEHDPNTQNVIDWGLEEQDDYRLCSVLQQEMSKADLVIGQNSDKFDIKFFRGRLWQHKLPNVECLTTLDTLKLSRAAFNLNSHKLDYLLKRIGLPGKIKMSLDDWVGVVLKKDRDSLTKMSIYNVDDVVNTRLLLHDMLPYVDTGRVLGSLIHGPKMYKPGTHTVDPVLCPNCGPDSETMKNGYRTTATGSRYQRRQCLTCHKYFKGEKAA